MLTNWPLDLLALALLTGCGSPGTPMGPPPGPDDERPADADELPLTEAEHPPPDAEQPASSPRVPLPTGWIAAAEPPESGCIPTGPCVDDYLALPERLGRARVTTRSALNGTLSEILRTASPDGPAEPPALPLDELQRILFAGAALDGLLPTADPAVRVLATFEVDGLTVQRLLLEDPLLGRIDAVLALAPKPRGVVLGLHGHGEPEDSFLLERHGLALARAGWTVLAPRQRAYLDGASESEASYHLLEHGMTLMGAEIAESLRWLRWLRLQHGQAPVLIGHSGGAAIALFASTIDPSVRGVIVDGTPQLTNWSEEGIADETLPALVPYRWSVTNLQRTFVPTRSLSDELNAELPVAALLTALDSLGTP